MGDIISIAPFLPSSRLSSPIKLYPGNAYLTLLACSSIIFLLGSLIVGQIYRLPLAGQGGGLLLSDIATIATLLSAILYGLFYLQHRQPIPRSAVTLTFLISLFAIWALIGLAYNSSLAQPRQLFIAISYWFRLISTLLLLPALILLWQNRTVKTITWTGFWLASGVLCLLGLVQVTLVPNLNFLTSLGWDPHQGRLVSTWLDPNLFGAFLLCILPVSLATSLNTKRVPSIICTILISIDLLLTQSRTSFIALTVGVICLLPFIAIFFIRGPRKSARLIVILSCLSLIIIGAITASLLLQARFIGIFLGDATTSLRLQSITAVFMQLALPHSLVGVGYNAYQFVAADTGLISDFTIHSRAGSDNSWLNLWVTTGLPGLILFCLPWLYASRQIITSARLHKNPYLLASLISLFLLAIHSQAVNSLLYSHIQITMAIIIASTIYEPFPAAG